MRVICSFVLRLAANCTMPMAHIRPRDHLEALITRRDDIGRRRHTGIYCSFELFDEAPPLTGG